MPDELTAVDARLDAALAAMREQSALPPDAAARAAARAVLANAPAARTTTWWLRAAAAVTIVALGAAALASVRSPGATPDIAARPDAAAVVRDPAVGVTITPVVATTTRAIVFELDAPDASSVQVLGDFNQWSRQASAMQRGTDGHWRMTTLLPPGRYVYAFLVDGQTFRRDPLRDAVEDRDFGVTGSELVVGEAP